MENSNLKLGVGLAALFGAACYFHLSRQHPKLNVLIGDIGGTNVRLSLVEVQPGQDEPTRLYKQTTSKGSSYGSFLEAVQDFLKGTSVTPKLAVIAIAGPVNENTVRMSNMAHWGLIKGNELAEQLKMDRFVFINDFQAVAYAITGLQEADVIHINEVPLNNEHTKAVIGPGTGLGTAMLYAAPFRHRKRFYVMPREGGHVNFGASNTEQQEFYEFLKKEKNIDHLVLERVFCGPAIPDMFRFFAKRYPDNPAANTTPTSEQIIRRGMETTDDNDLHRKSLELFLDIYMDCIGDTILNTLCYGGLYLVGGLTMSVVDAFLSPKFLADYKAKRPYFEDVFKKIPIVVSKEVELGMKGAFIYARRLVFDLYDPNASTH